MEKNKSIARLAYKAICKHLGVPETYPTSEPESYKGGRVQYPAGEKLFDDPNVYCFDFNSFYEDLNKNLSRQHEKNCTNAIYGRRLGD